jgi:hypothetical protein
MTPTERAGPAAAAAGKLWGAVDCYILDDGQRVIAQRAILRALRNTDASRGHDRGDLGQYLARLPKSYAHLARGPEIEFRIPQTQGGMVRAVGRPPAFFVGVLRAYVEGFAAGELHKSQEPMARRAMALLSRLAEKGIEAMVDEACGVLRAAALEDTKRQDLVALIDERIRAREADVEERARAIVDERFAAAAQALLGTPPAPAEPAPRPKTPRRAPAPSSSSPSPPASAQEGPAIPDAPPTRGQALERLRLALRLTQENMSSKGGLGRVEVVRVEGGHNDATSYRMRAGLARAAALAIEDLSAYLDGKIDLEEAMARRSSPLPGPLLRLVTDTPGEHGGPPSVPHGRAR